MKRIVLRMFTLIFVVFLLPAAASAAWWGLMVERPGSWRQADWGPSGVLDPWRGEDAAVAILSARTGGFKGAFAVHSWIVVKRPGAMEFDRYDKVGWGNPVRRNAYPDDARWYSNTPEIVAMVRGEEAEALIGKVEAAIAAYPFNQRGGYTIYPGPNSNSFVQHVLWAVPELGARLPSNAVGRDFLPGFANLRVAPDWRDVEFTLGGLFGVSAGLRSGFEVHLGGLVAGIDIARPGIKVPAFGDFHLVD